MKVEGLHVGKVNQVLGDEKAPPANYAIEAEHGILRVLFQEKSYSGPGHTAAFAYGDIHPFASKARAIKVASGLPVNQPCRHAAAVAVKRLLNSEATKVIFLKKTFTKWNSFNAILKSIKVSYEKAGLACPIVCPIAGPMNAGVAAAVAAVKPAPVANPVWAIDPIAIAPLTGDLDLGEAAAVPSGRRDLTTAVCTMYALAEIGAALALSPAPSKEHGDYIRYTVFAREFKAFEQEYARRFARNLFDYLTLASVGEARHTLELRVGYTNGIDVQKAEAIKHAPQQILPTLERIFSVGKWQSGFGGAKWAGIVKAAEKYFTFQSHPIVFADHCVDLTHNGGLAFDKGFIFSQPESTEKYLRILDTKLKGSLLASTLTLNINSNAFGFILQAVSLDLIAKPTAKVNLVDEPIVKTVAWGTLPVTLVVKAPEVAARLQKHEAALAAKKAKAAAEYDAMVKGDDKPLFFIGQTDEEVEAFIKSLPIIHKKEVK